MMVLLRSLCIAGFFMMAQAVAFAQVASSDAEVKATYGAWKLKCAQLEGFKQANKCVLMQDLKLADQRNKFLSVEILKSYDDGSKYILRVIAPLGVILPRGLGLKVDGVDIGNRQFLKCTRDGCVTDAFIPDELMTKFKTGKIASFIVFMTPDNGLGFPVQLAGFNEGLQGLN